MLHFVQVNIDIVFSVGANIRISALFLCRLDEKISLGYVWLLLTWVPETAAIRQKMLYASTKATLKTEFGSAYIKDEVNATTKVRIME